MNPMIFKGHQHQRAYSALPPDTWFIPLFFNDNKNSTGKEHRTIMKDTVPGKSCFHREKG